MPPAMNKIFELIDETDFPPGVMKVANGTREVADVFLESKDAEGAFVGSTPISKYVYSKAVYVSLRLLPLRANAPNVVVGEIYEPLKCS